MVDERDQGEEQQARLDAMILEFQEAKRRRLENPRTPPVEPRADSAAASGEEK